MHALNQTITRTWAEVSWLTNLGMQTTGYGVILWAPTLFVMLLGVSPAEASYLFIFVSLAGFVGRFDF